MSVAASARDLPPLLGRIESQKRVVVHFDVNETIMMGDPAGGDTFEESINKAISKSAFVMKKKEGGEREREILRWWNGLPVDGANGSGSDPS